MPNYSYKCKGCSTRFQREYPDRDAFIADLPTCPACHSSRVRTFHPAGMLSPSVQNGINRANTYPYVSRRLPHNMADAPHDSRGHTVVLSKQHEDKLARAFGGSDTPMVRE